MSARKAKAAKPPAARPKTAQKRDQAAMQVIAQPAPTPSLQSSISTAGAFYQNTEQTLILVTQDKLELAFQEQAPRYARRVDWAAPLGILLAFGAALVTTNFKHAVFSAGTWKAVFVVGALLSLLWFLWELVRSFRTPKRPVVTEEFIGKVRGTGPAKAPIEFA